MSCNSCIQIGADFYRYSKNNNVERVYIAGGARVTDGALIKQIRDLHNDGKEVDPSACSSAVSVVQNEVEPEGVLVTKRRCDDKGNGNYTPFYRAYEQVVDGGVLTVTQVGNGFTDTTLTTAYAVTGTEKNCEDIGDTVNGVLTRGPILLSAGEVQVLPPLTQSFSVRRHVPAGGDGILPIGQQAGTIEHGNGEVDEIPDAAGYSWNAEGANHWVSGGAPTIRANDDTLVITYTELTA